MARLPSACRTGAARCRRPRDQGEMARTDADCVYLDISHLPAERVHHALPADRRVCRSTASNRRATIPVVAGRALHHGRRAHRPPGAQRPAAACTPAARPPAPACTAPTGWPAILRRSSSAAAAAAAARVPQAVGEDALGPPAPASPRYPLRNRARQTRPTSLACSG